MNASTHADVSRVALWFGLLGGAIAWTLHLLAASIVAEWGCFAGLDRHVFFGVTLIAWIILAASAILFLVAAAATWVAFRTSREIHQHDPERIDRDDTALFMAQAGLATSGVFLLIILAQMVPLLYFLSHC